MIKIRQREENGSKRNGLENDILDNRNRYFITTHYDIIILFVQDLHVICLDVHEICHGDV